ncbi:unnamed protein product, partial [Notodromas monacha]
FLEHYSFINAAYGFPILHERQFIRNTNDKPPKENVTIPRMHQYQIENYVASYIILAVGLVLLIVNTRSGDTFTPDAFTGLPVILQTKSQQLKRKPSAVLHLNSFANITGNDFAVNSFAPWFFVSCDPEVPSNFFGRVDNSSIGKPTRATAEKSSGRAAVRELCRKMLVDCFWYRGKNRVSAVTMSRDSDDGCPVMENFRNLTGHTLVGLSIVGSIPKLPNSLYELDVYSMDTACDYLKCNVEMKPVLRDGFGTELKNKTWTGLMGDLQNGPDNYVGVMVPTSYRTVVVDFTTGALRLIKYSVMVQPFDWYTWLLIIGGTLITAVFLGLLAAINADDERPSLGKLKQYLLKSVPDTIRGLVLQNPEEELSSSDHFRVGSLGFQLVPDTIRGLVLQNPEEELSSSDHFRVGSLGFQLGTIVVTVAYSSMLTALIALPDYERSIDDLDDVVALKATVHLHIFGGATNTRVQEDLNALTGSGEGVRSVLVPDIPYQTILNGFQNRITYMNSNLVLFKRINIDVTANITEEFYYSKEKMYQRFYSFGLRKKSRYWRFFEHFSFVNAAYGYPQLHARQFVRNTNDKLPKENVTVPRLNQEQIENYVASFIILAVGFVLSVVTFIAEIFLGYLEKRRGLTAGQKLCQYPLSRSAHAPKMRTSQGRTRAGGKGREETCFSAFHSDMMECVWMNVGGEGRGVGQWRRGVMDLNRAPDLCQASKIGCWWLLVGALVGSLLLAAPHGASASKTTEVRGKINIPDQNPGVPRQCCNSLKMLKNILVQSISNHEEKPLMKHTLGGGCLFNSWKRYPRCREAAVKSHPRNPLELLIAA